MPIDSNIAMGIRPIEQPNMLGQMAQAMAIRQAQQGYEEQNALRNFYAQGGNPATAEGRQRLMATSPSAGIKLIGAQSEINARDVGTAEKTISLFKNQIGNVTDHTSALRWASALYDNPLTGSLMQSMAPKEQALAAIPSDPAGLEAWKRKAGLTADKLFEDANTIATNKARIQAAGISAAPANARLAYDMANPTQHYFTGDNGDLMGVSTRGGNAGAAPVPMAGASAPSSQVTIGGGGATPMGAGSSIMTNPAPVNALAPSAPINQNALITQAQPTLAPAAPTYAKVRSTPVTKDIVDPTDPTGRRMITVEVNNYKAGTGLGVDGKQTAPAGVLGVASSQIPANFEPDPKVPGGVKPIAGGPADPAYKAQQTTETLSAKDIAARNAKYPVATQAVKSFEANATDLEKDITELLTHKGLNSITGIAAGRMSGVTDEGRAALAIYNRIVAKGGFSELQSLRNASPTGGALGNISNQEGTQLKEAFATIDRKQEAEDVRKGLRDALIRVQGAKERVREGYDMTYSYKNAAPSGFTYVGKE